MKVIINFFDLSLVDGGPVFQDIRQCLLRSDETNELPQVYPCNPRKRCATSSCIGTYIANSVSSQMH